MIYYIGFPFFKFLDKLSLPCGWLMISSICEFSLLGFDLLAQMHRTQ